MPRPVRLPPDSGACSLSAPFSLPSTNLACDNSSAPLLGGRQPIRLCGLWPLSPCASFKHFPDLFAMLVPASRHLFPPPGCSSSLHAHFPGQTPTLPSDLSVGGWMGVTLPDLSPLPGEQHSSPFFFPFCVYVIVLSLSRRDGKLQEGARV